MSKKVNYKEMRNRILDLENELQNLWQEGDKIKSSPVFNAEKIRNIEESLLDNINDGITILDEQGKVVYTNETAIAQHGYEKKEVIGKPLLQLIEKVENVPNIKKAIEDVFNGELPQPAEYIIYFKNGVKSWVNINLSLSKNPIDGSVRLIAVHRDISHNKKMLLTLKNSEERLYSLIKNSPDIISNIDRHGNILFINRTTSSSSPDEIIGTNIYDYVLPEFHAKVKNEIKHVFETGLEGNYEAKVRDLDKVIRWYATRIAPIKQGENIRAVTLDSRDITEQKEAEEEQQKLLTLIDNTDSFVGLSDLDGNMTYLNKGGRAMVGLPEEGEIPKKIEDYSHSYKATILFDKILPQAIKLGSWTGEICLKDFKTGERVYTHGKILRLNHPDTSKPMCFAASLRNITDHKKAEKKLRSATKKAEEANQIRTEFLANISHELKTPMIGILGFAKLGIERFNDVKREKLETYFSSIHFSGNKLLGLLNNLLDLSKLEVGKMKYDFQVEKLSMVFTIILNELFLLFHKNGISVEYIKPEFADYIKMDVDKIGQVIRNLLTNAVKFSTSQSTIKIKIEKKEKNIECSIIDSGNGIPQKELNRIFDKFIQSSQTKTGAGGVGLGLAISKEIIMDHNGKIWAKNNPDGGSIFSFQLPLAAKRKKP